MIEILKRNKKTYDYLYSCFNDKIFNFFSCFFYINQRFVCDFNYAMNCCRDTRTDLEFNFNFFYSQKLYELYKYINVNNYYNIEIFQFEK